MLQLGGGRQDLMTGDGLHLLLFICIIFEWQIFHCLNALVMICYRSVHTWIFRMLNFKLLVAPKVVLQSLEPSSRYW